MANAVGTASPKAAEVAAGTGIDLIEDITDGSTSQMLMFTLFLGQFLIDLRANGVSLTHVDD